MNTEAKEICEKLRALSKILKLKTEAEVFLSKSEEDYVKENVKLEKPEIKKIEQVTEPVKPSLNKIVILPTVIIGIIAFFVPFWIDGKELFLEPVILAMLIGFVVLVFCFAFGIFIALMKEYKSSLLNFKKTVEQNKKNKEYNNTLPELIKSYNQTISDCKESYYQKYREYKEKLATAEQIIKKYDGIVAPKFYKNIDGIVEIIEDGRADSLKEAINIFISDSRQKDLVKAQKERNKIAEQQRWDAQRHNMAMEEQARRQADAIKQQEEARRRGAPSCWACKNFPCGGDPAYCGSFIKNQ